MTINHKEPVLGILGVGHLASYSLTTLRKGGYDGRVVLSPRNVDRSKQLSQQFQAEIAENNQQVIDAADVVLLSVRPQNFVEALAGLHFDDSKIVLSALAGVSLAETKAHLPATVEVVRMMPSSFIEAGDAVFPIFPANKTVESILAHDAKVVVFDNEKDFDGSVVVSAFYCWSYGLMASAISMLVDKGWPEKTAREMVQSHLRGATTFAAANPDKSIEQIYQGIATDGTFTKMGMDYLFDNDAFKPWQEAMELLHDKLIS